MKCVKEGLCLIRMTAATLLHHLSPESRLVDTRDGVRGMTVFASGIFFVGIRVVRPVDTGAERLFYPVVAGTTGTGNILRMDQSLWIIWR